MATASLSHHSHHLSTPFSTPVPPPPTSSPVTGHHFCKDCSVMFESSTSLEVHLSYHKENLLSRWAAQDALSSSNNSSSNMDSKPHIQQQQQQQQQPQQQQSVSRSPSPYFQAQSGQSQYMPTSQYNNNTGDPPTTTAPTAYRPAPPYPDSAHAHQHQHYSGANSSIISLQQQQQQLFSPRPRHYDGEQANNSDQPPQAPPPVKTERPPETPAEILDLDSNKVHVYHLPHQQGGQGSFYRPYLMSQLPPPPPNGGWALPPSDPFSPPFPLETGHPHHHHLAGLYGGPPPNSSNVVLYDFGGPEGRPAYGHEHQAPPPMGYPVQSTPSFRGTFPPPPTGAVDGGMGSPGAGRHSPMGLALPPGKKGKKSQGVKNGRDGETGSPKPKGWKGGECKRPKTYNCVACNKWFTSSGHLKRHYGTTLHKNSVRQKGDNPEDEMPPVPPVKKGKRSLPDPSDSSNPVLEMDTSLPRGPSPRTLNNGSNLLIKAEDSTSGSGKSTPILFGARPEFLSTGLPSPNPPYNFHGYNGPIQQYGAHGFHHMGHPPVSFSNGFPPESGLPAPSIYSVPSPIVPAPGYNGGYPPISVNGDGLPPFSSVGYSHYGGELVPAYAQPHPSPGALPNSRMTPNGNGGNGPPAYLHHGSLGPPGPGSPQPPPGQVILGLDSSYDSEPGNNGSLNRESPEAIRSSSIASGSMEGSLDGLSDEGSPIRNGSLSSGSASSGSSGSGSSGSEPEPPPLVVIKCPNCSKTFNRSCYLTQHKNSSHSGGKPFKCPTCGKRFPEDTLLSDHVAKHGSNKPYKCDLCPKQFNHKTDLRRHLCLHTGEKPFSCHVCGKGFIRKDHMTKHCETHRKVLKGSAAAAAAAAAQQVVQQQH